MRSRRRHGERRDEEETEVLDRRRAARKNQCTNQPSTGSLPPGERVSRRRKSGRARHKRRAEQATIGCR
jgi:hypothetical protein